MSQLRHPVNGHRQQFDSLDAALEALQELCAVLAWQVCFGHRSAFRDGLVCGFRLNHRLRCSALAPTWSVLPRSHQQNRVRLRAVTNR